MAVGLLLIFCKLVILIECNGGRIPNDALVLNHKTGFSLMKRGKAGPIIKQSTCKPGSVPLERGVCHSSMTYIAVRLKRSTLRLERAALKRRYTRTCSSQDAQPVHRCTAGGLLPRLLTLTLTGGCFLLHYSAFADSFLLGSGMLCAARTFLLCAYSATATDRSTVFVSLCKDTNKRAINIKLA